MAGRLITYSFSSSRIKKDIFVPKRVGLFTFIEVDDFVRMV